MFIIYIKPHCKYSNDAVKLVVRKKLSHQIILINNEKKQNQIKIKNNYFTFPQVFYNNTFIGGYDNLRAYVVHF
jgi:glutaredoxin